MNCTIEKFRATQARNTGDFNTSGSSLCLYTGLQLRLRLRGCAAHLNHTVQK